MLVTLNLEPETVEAYDNLGKQTHRSRKAFMEMILSEHIKKLDEIELGLNGEGKESKTDKHLPGLTAGFKHVTVKPHNPSNETPKYKIVNGKKVFK